VSGAVAQGTVAYAARGHGNGSNHANSPAPDLPTEERTTDVEAWRERIESRRAKAGATRALTAAALAAQNAAANVPVEPTPIPLEDVDVVEPHPVPTPTAPVKVDAKTAQRLAWVTAYLAGDSILMIAQRHGVAVSTVHKHLRAAGVQMRPTGAHRPRRSPSAPPVAPSAPAPLSTPVPDEPEEVDPAAAAQSPADAEKSSRRAQAVAEYSAGGVSIATLAARNGVAKATLRRWLIAANVPIRPARPVDLADLGVLGRARRSALRERMQAAGVTSWQVRDWARTRGLPAADRGLPAVALIEAYLRAHPAPEPEEPAEESAELAAEPEAAAAELPAAPVCEGCQGPATTEDREGVPLCSECADDSSLCGRRTFGGRCEQEHGHDGPCTTEDGTLELAAATATAPASDLDTPEVTDVAAALADALAAATQIVEGYRAFVVARLRAARAGIDALLAAMGETP
jgi:transposase-like protein